MAEDGQVAVVAILAVKPGKEQEAEQALGELVANSHEEEGCVRYALHRVAGDPSRLVIIERWRSQADLDAHFGMPHMADLGAKAGDLLSGGPEILFLEPVAVGDPVKS